MRKAGKYENNLYCLIFFYTRAFYLFSMKSILSKIYPRDELVKTLKPLKASGKKIGVTNGAFDLLHSGHVQYLEKAKEKCDVLVVSLNTDTSVKEYKDPNRPVISEENRAIVVAALESVDYVTFHNERRMRATLEALQPNYYIKGADYTEKTLSSSDVLKKWGGKYLLIPFVKGQSTTGIIKKIMDLYGNQPVEIVNPNKSSGKNKAIILDRDGVINEEVEYLYEPEQFRFVSHALEGIKAMQNMGYHIVIVTTQAGIGLGYFTKEDFFRVNRVMLKGFRDYGIVISKIYFCPHAVFENCNCRKPKIGLIERAKEDLHLDLSQSWMIGDKTSDILAGKHAGVRTILVKTGHGNTNTEYDITADYECKDLEKAAEIIKLRSIL